MVDLPPNKVLLRQSGMTGRVYAITRWKDDGHGNITSQTKTDVTDQFHLLAKQLGYEHVKFRNTVTDEEREAAERAIGNASTSVPIDGPPS